MSHLAACARVGSLGGLEPNPCAEASSSEGETNARILSVRGRAKQPFSLSILFYRELANDI